MLQSHADCFDAMNVCYSTWFENRRDYLSSTQAELPTTQIGSTVNHVTQNVSSGITGNNLRYQIFFCCSRVGPNTD